MKPSLSATAAFRFSALIACAGVALGAFGAHALRDVLEKRQRTEVWKTAVLYHLVHAAILLFLATRPRFRAGPWITFATGILLFSGSLYALAAFAPDWSGAVTPFGGVLFMGGYLALAWQARDWAATS